MTVGRMGVGEQDEAGVNEEEERGWSNRTGTPGNNEFRVNYNWVLKWPTEGEAVSVGVGL